MSYARNPLIPLDPTSRAARAGPDASRSFVEFAIRSTKPSDMALIRKLIERALEVATERRMLIISTMQLGLDIAIAHARRPLKLGQLVLSSDQDIYDEIVGISQHVDRTDGRMRDGWESRYWAGPER